MAQPWWKDVITQAFNPPVEMGQDIGTPYGTAVTALQGGTVKDMITGAFGERIDINAGGSTVEYYQHLDSFAPGLRVGSQVTAGELLGESGGQLAGGQHPNSPLDSTGPHIEVGETVGGRPVDPSQLIAAGPQTGGGSLAGAATGNPSNWLQALGNLLCVTNPATAAVGAGVSTAGTDIQHAGGALVDVSFPDPIASLRDWFGSGLNQAKSEAQGAPGFWNDPSIIIPLVVAALVMLVILGAGNKTQSAPQIIPVPV